MKNKISIIIANWNGEKWLNKCLTSLSNQTYEKIEIIIVDNASLDNSISYIKSNFPNVKIIKNKQNLGFSKANNLGVKASHGEYILMLNNDTWVEKDFVEKLVNFYKKNNYSVISPVEKRYFTKQAVEYCPTVDISGSHVYLPLINKTKKLFFLPGICLFFSKAIYLETKGLDNDFFMYFEDVDWFWRLNLFGKTFSYVNNVFVYHVGAGGAGYGIRYNTFLWRNQNILQMLIKNYSFPVLVLVLFLYFVQNIIEIIFFLLIFKPRIANSYVKGWQFNMLNFKRTLKKRKWVQEHRKISDLEIFKKMYFGSGKLLLLKHYL